MGKIYNVSANRANNFYLKLLEANKIDLDKHLVCGKKYYIEQLPNDDMLFIIKNKFGFCVKDFWEKYKESLLLNN